MKTITKVLLSSVILFGNSVLKAESHSNDFQITSELKGFLAINKENSTEKISIQGPAAMYFYNKGIEELKDEKPIDEYKGSPVIQYKNFTCIIVKDFFFKPVAKCFLYLKN